MWNARDLSTFESMEHWERELAKFIKRHSAIQAIKGALLFLAALSVLWVLAAYTGLALENNTSGRLIVLITSVSATTYLAWRFWIPALMVLLGLKKGMSSMEAARLIRKWIPEAEDKIVTTIELKEKAEASELWSAAAEQHNKRVGQLPIEKASPLSEAKPSAKWVLIPTIIALILTALGGWEEVRTGSSRVISFNEKVDPLQGFRVELKTSAKEWTSDRTAYLQISHAAGPNVLQLQLFTNGVSETVWLDKTGRFTRRLELPAGAHVVEAYAAGLQRGKVRIKVQPAPQIMRQEVIAQLPAYSGGRTETEEFGKNLAVPRGTKISLNLEVDNCREVRISKGEKVLAAGQTEVQSYFLLEKDTELRLDIKDLTGEWRPIRSMRLEAIEDQAPSLVDKWQLENDSSLINTYRVVDDFGLRGLELVITTVGEVLRHTISEQRGKSNEGVLRLDARAMQDTIGKISGLQLQVRDNHTPGPPNMASGAFYPWGILNNEERSRRGSEEMQSLSGEMEKAREDWKKREEEAKREEGQVRTSGADWRALNELKERGRELMKETEQRKERMEKRKKILEDWKKKDSSGQVEEIVKRLEEMEMKELRNRLDELKKALEEGKKKDILKKLDEERKKNNEMRVSERRLEEMMKRAEVDMRFQLSMEDLQTVLEKQEQALEGQGQIDKAEEQQKEITKDWKKWQSEFEEMLQRNKDLKEPMDIGEMAEQRTDAEKEIEEAQAKSEEEEGGSEGLMKEQKESAEQLQELLRSMQSMSSGMQQEQHVENMETLRQIQDNLLVFSKGEEGLAEELQAMRTGDPSLSRTQANQQRLRSGASVIQDSLRALAERVPQLKESVFERLGRMISAAESASRNMSERQVGKASSESQYAMTAANELALMLDETMQQMQAQMKSMMSGQGSCSKPGGASPNASGMKKAQSQLMGQMKKGLQKGQKPGGRQEGKQKGQGGTGLSAQEFAQLLQQQEALRQMWEKMSQDAEEAGGGTGGNKALELMKESERELALMKLTPESLERQKQIETRMLEHERAKMERERDEQRKSERGQERMENTSGESEGEQLPEKTDIDLFIRDKPEYKSFYRERIKGWKATPE